MAEPLQAHKVFDLDRLGFTHAVDVVTREIDQHDVFRTVFLRVEQFLAKPLVLCQQGQ